MSDARPDPAAPPPATSLRQAVSSAGLLVVVLAILLGSRLLRSGPPEHRPAPKPPPLPSLSSSVTLEGFASLERVVDPAPAPPVPKPEPDAALVALAERAAADAARLAGRKGGWTVQVSRHCSTALVQEKLRRHGGAKELLLVPAEQDDRACFIVCWGTYADRQAATRAAATVPAALKGDGKPFAKSIAEVLP